MPTFIVSKPPGFSLRAAQDFYSGFVPGSGMAAASAQRLTLAFRLDRTFEAVAVRVTELGDELSFDVSGTDDTKAVTEQVGRILGLEADGADWRRLGQRDELVGKLQREFPGFYTAAKSSPYDAATWAILATRMPMKAAASVKMALGREHGDCVRIGGAEHHVFPSPDRLQRVRDFPGVSAEKMERLRGVARAALDGKLDASRLRAMGETGALRELAELRGIGPWGASHIYYRGAAPMDGLPLAEPRVVHGLAHVLGVHSVSTAEFVRRAESWRPFRMWVCVLLSRHLARTDGWNAPGLVKERARAARLASKPLTEGAAVVPARVDRNLRLSR